MARPGFGKGPTVERAAQAEPYGYANRKGVTYYLHRARTKKGKTHLVMKRSLTQGALEAVPGGRRCRQRAVRRGRGEALHGRAGPFPPRPPELSLPLRERKKVQEMLRPEMTGPPREGE